jgi:hypothetical protein
MSDVTVLDNLDLDLSSVDLTRPLIDNQVVLARTGEVRIEMNEQKQKRLVIPLTLEEPATSTSGKPVNVGFQITHSILATPTGKLTQERINEELAKFQMAVLKLEKPTVFGPMEQYRNQLVRVKFSTRADKDDPNKLYQDAKAWIKAS